MIESKPESVVHDYRFGYPWPELEKMATDLDLDELDEAEHSHVPYGMCFIERMRYLLLLTHSLILYRRCSTGQSDD